MGVADVAGGAAVSIWDATRYGWAPIYYLTIEGISTVFTEGRNGAALGLTLPTDYTAEAACLSLQDAGIGTEQIDRQRGSGVGPPLQFRLLDCSAVTTLLTRWTAETRLTQIADYNDGTLTVDDTTGFASPIYLGRELVTYTGSTPTTFTGCTRGVCGFAYTHRPGTSGQTVTNRPRLWRGRHVTLWAKPCDQGGAVPGTALATDAVQVWRGRIVAGPSRQRDGFDFECEQLDRVLDAPLSGKLSGKVVAVGGKYAVDYAQKMLISVYTYDAASALIANYVANIPIWQGSGESAGALVTGAAVRARVTAAWSAWVSANGHTAIFGDLVWYNPQIGPKWRSAVQLKKDVTVCRADLYMGAPFQYTANPIIWPGGMTATAPFGLETGWFTSDNPFDNGGQAWGVTVELDDAQAADVPSTGLLRVKLKALESQFAYTTASAVGKQVYLGGTLSKTAFPTGDPSLVGADCYIYQGGVDTYGDLMLTAIESSGTGSRGTFDTAAQSLGYAIDETLIDTDSFTIDAAVQFDGQAVFDSGAFADVFGGVLGLFRRAVVLRVDDGVAKLHLVSTDPGGTANADTITDADLLAHESDPVESVARALAPNAVKLTMLADTDGQESTVEFNAAADIEATGRRSVEYKIKAVDRAALAVRASAMTLGLFHADQTAQALKIFVGPWVTGEVGDVVRLSALTHPAIWSYVTGATGYTGTGRVVGRVFNPVTQRVELTLLIDGAIKVTALCPSAPVSAFTNTAANPSSITIPGRYLDVMQTALAGVASFKLLHYKPGFAESAAELHTVTAAADSGGDCLLTISATAGGHSLVTGQSYLTFPTSDGGDSNATQDQFAHADDGGNWG